MAKKAKVKRAQPKQHPAPKQKVPTQAEILIGSAKLLAAIHDEIQTANRINIELLVELQILRQTQPPPTPDREGNWKHYSDRKAREAQANQAQAPVTLPTPVAAPEPVLAPEPVAPPAPVAPVLQAPRKMGNITEYPAEPVQRPATHEVPREGKVVITPDQANEYMRKNNWGKIVDSQN